MELVYKDLEQVPERKISRFSSKMSVNIPRDRKFKKPRQTIEDKVHIKDEYLLTTNNSPKGNGLDEDLI